MGSWNITIQGVGVHHNHATSTDANRMAQDFVCKLREAGHTVESATFTSGGRDDLQTVDYSAYET